MPTVLPVKNGKFTSKNPPYFFSFYYFIFGYEMSSSLEQCEQD